MSQRGLDAAARGLFYSLPIAFDPAEAVEPYLASVDRDPAGDNLLLDALWQRAAADGFVDFSTLIEERLLATGPAWLKAAPVLERVENYLRSGITFVYLQALLQPSST